MMGLICEVTLPCTNKNNYLLSSQFRVKRPLSSNGGDKKPKLTRALRRFFTPNFTVRLFTVHTPTWLLPFITDPNCYLYSKFNGTRVQHVLYR